MHSRHFRTHKLAAFGLSEFAESWRMREQKITLGEMRDAGLTGLLIFCSDYRCSHGIEISAEPWPDEVRLSDLEPRFVRKVCGRRGADIRPNFRPARRGPAATRLSLTCKLNLTVRLHHRSIGTQNRIVARTMPHIFRDERPPRPPKRRPRQEKANRSMSTGSSLKRLTAMGVWITVVAVALAFLLRWRNRAVSQKSSNNDPQGR